MTKDTLKAAGIIAAFTAGWLGCIVGILATHKNTSYAAETETEAQFITEAEETAKTPEIESQTTEETTEESHETETATDPEEETEAPKLRQLGCCGKFLPDYFFYSLVDAHVDAGIEWWLPYAIAEAFQESSLSFTCEASNGLDKGLWQYRTTFWPSRCEKYGLPAGADIFDPYNQLAVYVQEFSARLNSGLTPEEALAAHFNSGDPAEDKKYVADVVRWLPYLNYVY